LDNDETINSYRACFMSDAGKRVLGHLLLDAGYFDADAKTSEESAVRDFVTRILHNCGIGRKPQTMSGFVNKLFELGIEDGKKENQK